MAEFSNSVTGPQVDVKQTPAYRAALAAVIILGALIVIALGILIAGFAFKLRGHKAGKSPGAAAETFTPPTGAKVISTELGNDRLILRLRTDAGEEVDIIDTQSGHLVARLKFASATR